MTLWREKSFPVHGVLPVLPLIIIVCKVNRKDSFVLTGFSIRLFLPKLAHDNNLMQHRQSLTVMTYMLFTGYATAVAKMDFRL